jgi:hypothetical protein
MRKTTYGKSWFLAKRRFTEQWDESQAADAHAKRKPYAAAIRNEDGCVTVVDARDDYYGVDFLDAIGREYLSYQFQELEPGRLFLTMATHREFDGETDRVSYGTTYYFKPDGSVTVETEDFATANLATKEMKVDVNGNWETYPNFGDYGSLTRVDR